MRFGEFLITPLVSYLSGLKLHTKALGSAVVSCSLQYDNGVSKESVVLYGSDLIIRCFKRDHSLYYGLIYYDILLFQRYLFSVVERKLAAVLKFDLIAGNIPAGIVDNEVAADLISLGLSIFMLKAALFPDNKFAYRDAGLDSGAGKGPIVCKYLMACLYFPASTSLPSARVVAFV